MSRRKKIEETRGIWNGSSSSSLLHRRWEATSPAKPRKRNKQWFLFYFLLLRSSPDLLSFRSVSSVELFFSLFHLLLCFTWPALCPRGGGRPAAEFLSCLCNCRWPVRVLARMRACGPLPFGCGRVLLENGGQIEVNGLWACCPLAGSRGRLKETGKWRVC